MNKDNENKIKDEKELDNKIIEKNNKNEDDNEEYEN